MIVGGYAVAFHGFPRFHRQATATGRRWRWISSGSAAARSVCRSVAVCEVPTDSRIGATRSRARSGGRVRALTQALAEGPLQAAFEEVGVPGNGDRAGRFAA